MFNQPGAPQYSAYCASKAGVEALTKTAAKEWGKIPIRCNAVCPGAIDTPMLRSEPPESIQSQIEGTPLGRIGDPEGRCFFSG